MLKKIIAALFGKENAENAAVARGTEWMYGAVDSRPAFDEVPTYAWVLEKPVWQESQCRGLLSWEAMV